MNRIAPVPGIAAVLMLLHGCHAVTKAEPVPPPTIAGDKVVMVPNSPQISSLVIEPAGTRQGSIVRLTGRVTWNDDATVRVFSPFAGRVKKILVAVGQRVKKGTPLVNIESPDFGQAQADARRADADFHQAERSLARIRDLYEHGAAPRKDLEAAENDLARARAERERTLARLASFGAGDKVVDEAFTLRSPLDGVVVERNVNPGQEVRPDQMLANAPQLFAPMFVITDPDTLWLQLDASERDLSRLTPGDALAVRTQAYPDETFTGRIDAIGDALDPATRTVKVRGTIDNRDRRLKAEMYVSVDIKKDGIATIEVSKRAVLMKNERYWVFVEEKQGSFKRTEVRIGDEHDGRITVLDGIGPGQRVVNEGGLLLEQLLETPEDST